MASNDPINGGDDSVTSFEAKLFKASEKLRGNMELADYKHVTLGLIFLKFISDNFEDQHAKLKATASKATEDQSEYQAIHIFWVPTEAHWSYLQDNAKDIEIGELIDAAMIAVEQENAALKDLLPKNYAQCTAKNVRLNELIKLISSITLNEEDEFQKGIHGRVFEYFLDQFAGTENKQGGEFHTPHSVVHLLVEMLEPYWGRVYDPCCRTGDTLVQSEKFVQEHGGRLGDIATYGQELNATSWRLCKMNFAVHAIDSNVFWSIQDALHEDKFAALPPKDGAPIKADYIFATPPFNHADWGGEQLQNDPRWQFGVPPANNANFAWLQYILHHLAAKATAGVVLANGSLTSHQGGQGEIRKAMIEADVVDCIVALPARLFYSTPAPACVWFLARDKSNGLTRNAPLRDRRGEILFIDARKLGHLIEPTRHEITEDDIALIANTYHAWRAEPEAGKYEDVSGYCKSASLDEIRKRGHVLAPGRYVGVDEGAQTGNGEPFSDMMQQLTSALREQQAETAQLDADLIASLKELGYGD